MKNSEKCLSAKSLSAVIPVKTGIQFVGFNCFLLCKKQTKSRQEIQRNLNDPNHRQLR